MVRKSGRAATSDSVTISGAKLDAIRAVLCCIEFKGIWTPAGEILGLSQPRQSSTLFRNAIAPMGLDLKDGKVFKIGANNDDAAAAATSTTTDAAGVAPKASPKRKGGKAAKKTKTEADAADEGEAAAEDDAGAGPGEGGKVDAAEAEKRIKVEGPRDAA